jgi:hypothetical protein
MSEHNNQLGRRFDESCFQVLIVYSGAFSPIAICFSTRRHWQRPAHGSGLPNGLSNFAHKPHSQWASSQALIERGAIFNSRDTAALPGANE